MILLVDEILVFFKQKTSYEMRISDWSSDVCSSDLWPNQIAEITTVIPRSGCDSISAAVIRYRPIANRCPGKPPSRRHSANIQAVTTAKNGLANSQIGRAHV